MARASIRAMAVPDATPGAAAPEHVGGRIEVVARLTIRRGLVLEGRHRPDRHHLTAGVAGFEAADVLRSPTELLVRLGQNLIRATEVVEVVHVLRAKVQLEGREHVGRSETDLLRFLTVDVGVKQRSAGVVEGEDPCEVRIFIRRCD